MDADASLPQREAPPDLRPRGLAPRIGLRDCRGNFGGSSAEEECERASTWAWRHYTSAPYLKVGRWMVGARSSTPQGQGRAARSLRQQPVRSVAVGTFFPQTTFGKVSETNGQKQTLVLGAAEGKASRRRRMRYTADLGMPAWFRT